MPELSHNNDDDYHGLPTPDAFWNRDTFARLTAAGASFDAREVSIWLRKQFRCGRIIAMNQR
jgi:hypothetical protein